MALVPKNWKEFQHYRDRKPAWIKLHGAILDDFEYFRLPVASKAIAPLLWLLAREYDEGAITASLEEIAFRMRMPVPDLIEALRPLLASKFFLYDKDMPECFQDASALLAPRKQDAMPEKEKEGETERETEGHSPSTVAAATAAGAGEGLDDGSSPVIAKAVASAVAGKLFEDFWTAYPKRDGANPKQPARKKFLAAAKSGDNPDAIIAGARGYAEELRRTNKLNTSFVAQAATWLNQRRWEDYQAQAPKVVTLDPTVPINPIWAPARERLLADLGPEIFSSWFRSMAFASVDDDHVCMTVPSRFAQTRIETEYMPRLLRAWQATRPGIEFVKIIVERNHH